MAIERNSHPGRLSRFLSIPLFISCNLLYILHNQTSIMSVIIVIYESLAAHKLTIEPENEKLYATSSYRSKRSWLFFFLNLINLYICLQQFTNPSVSFVLSPQHAKIIMIDFVWFIHPHKLIVWYFTTSQFSCLHLK